MPRGSVHVSSYQVYSQQVIFRQRAFTRAIFRVTSLFAHDVRLVAAALLYASGLASLMNVVWLKRDVRLHDHEPLALAAERTWVEILPSVYL